MNADGSKILLPFNVPRTLKTMEFDFDPDTETISLRGKFIPEDNLVFFEPILEWMDTLIQNPPPRIKVLVQIDYFNTSSSKFILKIFKKLDEASKAGSDIVIHWIYEQDDWDMRDCGLDYKDIVKVPVKLVEISETDGMRMEEEDNPE